MKVPFSKRQIGKFKVPQITTTFLNIAASTFFARALRFVHLIIILRFLTLEEVGVFNYGVALYLSILAFSGMGWPHYLPQIMGRRPNQFNFILRHSIFVSVSMLLTSALFFVAFAWSPLSVVSPQVLTIFAGVLVMRGIILWAGAGLLALKRTRYLVIFEVIARISEIVGALVFLINGYGLMTICLIHFVAASMQAIFLLYFLFRSRFPIGKLNLTALRIVATQAVIISISVALVVVLLQIPIILGKGVDFSDGQLATMSLAFQIISVGLLIPSALTNAVIESLSAQSEAQSGKLASLNILIKLSLVIGLVTAGCLVLFGEFAVNLVFGGRYSSTSEILSVVAWALPSLSLIVLSLGYFNSQRRRLSAIACAALPIIFFLLLSLVFPHTPTGISIAFMLSNLICCLPIAFILCPLKKQQKQVTVALILAYLCPALYFVQAYNDNTILVYISSLAGVITFLIALRLVSKSDFKIITQQ